MTISLFMYFLVGIGGALGAISRVMIGSLLPATGFAHFPLRIIAVNIIGCFAMGFIVELLESHYTSSSNFRIFFTTGFLGGFTTFSSFALEFAQLTNKNFINNAITYAILSVGLSLISFFIGAKIAKLF
jgi:CrcB protein